MKNLVLAALLVLCLFESAFAQNAVASGSTSSASTATQLREYRAAAKWGDAIAQYNLGLMYALDSVVTSLTNSTDCAMLGP